MCDVSSERLGQQSWQFWPFWNYPHPPRVYIPIKYHIAES